MNKGDIYKYLSEKGIWHEITEHKAVYSMGDFSGTTLPYPDAGAKNLFVRDDKKLNFYLITVKGDKRVNLKEFRRKNGTRPLSFASENDLMEIMGLVPGAVSPFGLLNDMQCKVRFFIDEDFFGVPGLIGIHPNDNTATVWLKADDLCEMVRECGNEVEAGEI